ncbi:glycosyl transferase family 8 protein [Rutstroemia sp. NJR-2017a BVV2]|nr:glycosyl transferase family 8 protein [Rutstroemia sp. NJR-2017a BVV2]
MTVYRAKSLILVVLAFLCTWRYMLPSTFHGSVGSVLEKAGSAPALHDVTSAEETVMTTPTTASPSGVETAVAEVAGGTEVVTSSTSTTTSTQETEIGASQAQDLPTESTPSQETSIPSSDSDQNSEPEEQAEESQNEQSEQPEQSHDGQPDSSSNSESQQASIGDNFPLAMAAHSKDDLPPVPPWNQPPNPHVKERTPLFIGFTRNWRLLQQTVVGWITAGWPAEDIYVIENTGTMKSNQLGQLSMQNPFFLNHTRLHLLGVNVIVTPTLYTFAQLQNFFLWTAIDMELDHYFWSHMDIIPITLEDDMHKEDDYAGHRTIYKHAVEVLRQAKSPDPDPNASDPSKPWAMRFFAFDYLTLVNREAYEAVGGFDTTIPFYSTDCDMYDRLAMAGFETNEPKHLMTTIGNNFDGTDKLGAGSIYDVANSLDDLLVLYRKKGTGEASFTDQSRPEDVEKARKTKEMEDLVEQSKEQEEAKNVAAALQKAEADAHAHIEEEAEKEQAELDAQAEEINTQQQEAQNGGQSRNDSQSSENEQSQNSKREIESAKSEKRSLDTAHSKPPPKPGKWISDTPDSPDYRKLLDVARDLVLNKYSTGANGRNTWQRQQTGGQGEPYYKNPDGFEKAIQMTIDFGRSVYFEKWGTYDCTLVAKGVTKEDEWKVKEAEGEN